MNNKELFKNFNVEYYKKFPKSTIKILNNYINCDYRLTVQNNYGIYKIFPHHLYSGRKPSIKSAIDKTSYFINQLKKKFDNYYDYSFVEYINSVAKVKLINKFKEIIYLSPNTLLSKSFNSYFSKPKNNFISKDRGWEDHVWIKTGIYSKNFDSFKVFCSFTFFVVFFSNYIEILHNYII